MLQLLCPFAAASSPPCSTYCLSHVGLEPVFLSLPLMHDMVQGSALRPLLHSRKTLHLHQQYSPVSLILSAHTINLILITVCCQNRLNSASFTGALAKSWHHKVPEAV